MMELDCFKGNLTNSGLFGIDFLEVIFELIYDYDIEVWSCSSAYLSVIWSDKFNMFMPLCFTSCSSTQKLFCFNLSSTNIYFIWKFCSSRPESFTRFSLMSSSCRTWSGCGFCFWKRGSSFNLFTLTATDFIWSFLKNGGCYPLSPNLNRFWWLYLTFLCAIMFPLLPNKKFDLFNFWALRLFWTFRVLTEHIVVFELSKTFPWWESTLIIFPFSSVKFVD